MILLLISRGLAIVLIIDALYQVGPGQDIQRAIFLALMAVYLAVFNLDFLRSL
jgi:hypothetical protein